MIPNPIPSFVCPFQIRQDIKLSWNSWAYYWQIAHNLRQGTITRLQFETPLVIYYKIICSYLPSFLFPLYPLTESPDKCAPILFQNTTPKLPPFSILLCFMKRLLYFYNPCSQPNSTLEILINKLTHGKSNLWRELNRRKDLLILGGFLQEVC